MQEQVAVVHAVQGVGGSKRLQLQHWMLCHKIDMLLQLTNQPPAWY
jgi:hypothetical protein